MCAAVLAVAAGGMPQLAPAAGPAAPDRPLLQAQQGRYFRWSAPAGWQASETANGVDLIAPDGLTLVSSALLHGGFGAPSPREFVQMIMGQVNPSARIVGSTSLPGQPGIWGPWRAEDFEFSATVKGQPVRQRATVGISEGHGRFSASMTLYQAPAAQWERQRQWLPAVAQSISATNLRQLAGQDTVMLPRNNPLDNSGLIESWRRKGLSEDRISQGRREGTMGYTRMQDPNTGQRYDVPIEAYDGTVGGYRNPKHPDELLQKLPPGH